MSGKGENKVVLGHTIGTDPLIFNFGTGWMCRSQSPRGLRRRATAARPLRLWVRIPPGAGMFVMSVVCCQVEVSAMD